jgi:hypothetical protein
MKRTSKETKGRKVAGGIPRLGPRNRRGKVEPLKEKRAVGGDYDYGFTPPPERDPWVDEGRPETAG